MVDKNTGAGLRGQSAGETAICTVGAEGNSLRYRGYDVVELAEHSTFYEVAYMILKGELPTQDQRDAYKAKLKPLRSLPQPLREVLERIPADAHPMDVMRTGCSFLGNIEPEGDFSTSAAPSGARVPTTCARRSGFPGEEARPPIQHHQRPACCLWAVLDFA